MDYINRILYENIRNVLLENRESKNINLARKFLKSKGYDDENAQKILDGIRTDIPNSRLAQCKFLLGISRLYVEGKLDDGGNIQKFNKLLPYIASEAHVNEYDNNLNGMSLEDIENRFSEIRKRDVELSRKNSYSKKRSVNGNYNIVRIPDFGTASRYGGYTEWCVTHDKSMYDSYTDNGIGLFYFCLRKGFENVRKIKGENAPLDEYGLSMIAVSVDENGDVNTITCRWNHDMEGNDHIMSKDELEDLLGVNFYETFKPYSDEELMKKGYMPIKKLREMLDSGQELSNVLKSVQRMSNELFLGIGNNEKFIIYNINEGQIPGWINKWIDYIGIFKYGLCKVEIGDKMSFIDVEGNLIGGGKVWFDWVSDFNDGFAAVELDDKYSFIDTNGNLIGNGNLWFDGTGLFYEGFARVRRGNKKTFIDTKGNFIGNGKLWFDKISNFTFGFAEVSIGNDNFLIDKKGNFYDIETKRPIKAPLNNESVDRIGRILRECIDNYLNRKY